MTTGSFCEIWEFNSGKYSSQGVLGYGVCSVMVSQPRRPWLKGWFWTITWWSRISGEP